MSAESRVSWRPDWAIPPGEILAEALSDRGISQVELARRIGRPLKTVNEIVKGKSAITPETALQLEYALAIPARFWLNLEREFGEQKARAESRAALERSGDWVKRFPIRDLIAGEWIPDTRSKAEQLEGILRFFGVTTPEAWSKQWESVTASFRKSTAFKSTTEALAAWLRAGELVALQAECAPFAAERLEGLLPQLRSLTRLQPIAFEDQLVRVLADCGVALITIREFEGTHLYAASYWITPERAVIQLSLRQRKDDEFWFSLFHEIDHILRGSRRAYYVHGEAERSGNDAEESRADAFARRTLIPDDQIEGFVADGDLSEGAIQRFAHDVGVGAGVVVGRLQHDHKVGRNRGNDLKRPIRFVEDQLRRAV
ncbi:MAG: HigA family addiction module antidote protein [Chloroflexota bacterium]|nr:HigA family addiction module antidote protein [Chloroflexota bacterium]